MELKSNSFQNGDWIPEKYCFCAKSEAHHVCLSNNLNPHLAWSNAPEGTQAFAITCHDPDVPSVGDDVNQEGKSIPRSLPRVNFYHWAITNLPANLSEIQEGEYSNEVIPKGKAGPSTKHGAIHGINDYSVWFANDHDMQGDYYGYDGPCPPWNDELIHHYIFTVYALSTPVQVTTKFTGQQLAEAIKQHTLASANITGIYSLNPACTKTNSD